MCEIPLISLMFSSNTSTVYTNINKNITKNYGETLTPIYPKLLKMSDAVIHFRFFKHKNQSYTTYSKCSRYKHRLFRYFVKHIIHISIQTQTLSYTLSLTHKLSLSFSLSHKHTHTHSLYLTHTHTYNVWFKDRIIVILKIIYRKLYISKSAAWKRKEILFSLTMHSTHFIYGYMTSDIW